MKFKRSPNLFQYLLSRNYCWRKNILSLSKVPICYEIETFTKEVHLKFEDDIITQLIVRGYCKYHEKMSSKICCSNLFYPRVAFCLEASHLNFTANYVTGFYMKCNIGLKQVKLVVFQILGVQIFSVHQVSYLNSVSDFKGKILNGFYFLKELLILV